MKAALRLFVVAVAVTAVSGCGPTGQVSRTMPPPVAHIDRLGVHVRQGAAINWDDRPGPDGVFVRVYCYQYHQPKTVMVKGALVFMVFEGSLSMGTIAEAKPFQEWKFTTEQLPACADRDMVGWGYTIQLAWEKNVPKTRRITVVARFISEAGQETFSVPVSIPMAG